MIAGNEKNYSLTKLTKADTSVLKLQIKEIINKQYLNKDTTDGQYKFALTHNLVNN